ncbi:MAG: 3D-(3,5/4)-trihydroxycyclohexane-1,2-dione acylhydrolase (decyclizing) [Zetaproteobacteria bacterium]|nr:3D-(3,5/4)-trihydroxycyclohexane-1,2-dione acylhydrolase (decyclizing) [Pseudobdellovibrionaceae bacterium]
MLHSQNKIKLTTAQAIIKYLQAQNIRRDNHESPFFAGMWGIFGHGNVAGIGQALEENRSFKFYQGRNEQAMVHASVAYAKQKNRLQTFACTSSIGPGATNMLTGAALATINRLPVLLLPGDSFARRTPGPVLQQLEYPGCPEISVNDCFKPVSRFWDRIQRPEQILYSLPEAMRILTSQAETGAVTISLPQDVQTEAYDFPLSFFDTQVHKVSREIACQELIYDATEKIINSQKPLIIAGGGVRYSEAETVLKKFCEQTGIPCSETQAGKGTLVFNHPQSLGSIGATGSQAANRIAEQSDLIICIGTRLSDFTTASATQFQNKQRCFINLNINAFDSFKYNSLPLTGDAKALIEQLSSSLKNKNYQISQEYKRKITTEKEDWQSILYTIKEETYNEQKGLSQVAALQTINQQLAPEDTIICAAGSLPGDLHKLFNVEKTSQYHMEYGFSCMGYEISGGVGIALSKEVGETFIFVGDGSYLMMHTDIITALQENKKITLLIFENHKFNSIDKLSKNCGGQGFGNEFCYRNPETNELDGKYLQIDFAKNVESLGGKSFIATTRNELNTALEKAKDLPSACAIIIKVNLEKNVPSFSTRWEVPIAQISKSQKVSDARLEYEKFFT